MSQKCEKLHAIFNKMKQIKYSPNFLNSIPDNGIYIVFEEGENAHSGNRITRVGSHTGQGNLKNRLSEHYENEGRSIFRKKIGTAIMKKSIMEGNTFWTNTDIYDWNEHKYFERKKIFKNKGREKQWISIQQKVTEYIRKNITFVCFKVDDGDKRKYFEEKIISTISNCEECKQSKEWLGNYSDKPKVIKSGLWLDLLLWKDDLTDVDIDYLEEICNGNNNIKNNYVKETIFIDFSNGSGTNSTYYLSNDLSVFEEIIYKTIGVKINLSNIKESEWKINEHLSNSTKNIMNKHDLNYSMAFYHGIIINKRHNKKWYIYQEISINGSK
jgi:hypothetical protein